MPSLQHQLKMVCVQDAIGSIIVSRLFVDFETYSDVDIRKHGSMQYVNDPSTQIICLGFAFDHEPAQLWTPAQEFPKSIIKYLKDQGKVYAHNAIFDFRVWNTVLVDDFSSVPTLSLYQMIDTMALCQTYTLPASLANAGAALQIKLPKLEEGVRLINKCCKPDKKGRQPMYHENKAVFEELFMYCKRDVEAMREIVNILPRAELLPIEQKIWELTVEMNQTGLPIDEEAVVAILDYLAKYVKKEMHRVGTITGGFVQTVNQIAKILEWCELRGVTLPNLQAGTLVDVLSDEQMPAEVKDLLKLRQELGRTSTAKYKKIHELMLDGVVHDNLQFHGAGTGRWAGRGFQMQNLPRAKVKNPEEYIKMFKQGQYVEDPVTVGKALIRPMITAPEGMTLIVSDYSSIENRILAWLAGDTVTLDGFRSGYDQYIDMATALYHLLYDQINEEQRQFGKVVILGAGYMMGWRRFKEVALDWGIVLTDEEAQHAISVYREKYQLIVELWTGLKNAAIRAILTGQKQTYKLITFGTATVKGIRWLAMKLPSGKCVYYMQPDVEDHLIPGYEVMGPVPTIVHSGINPYSKKWSRLKVTPGRLTENATQATAREVMAQGMLNVRKYMPEVKLIGTCHDEALGLIKERAADGNSMEAFNAYLCYISWAPDCPLAAVGYYSKRYKKG